jgi:hypothetical protein
MLRLTVGLSVSELSRRQQPRSDPDSDRRRRYRTDGLAHAAVGTVAKIGRARTPAGPNAEEFVMGVIDTPRSAAPVNRREATSSGLPPDPVRDETLGTLQPASGPPPIRGADRRGLVGYLFHGVLS